MAHGVVVFSLNFR